MNMSRKTYLAPGAHVVGDVTLGENVGIWYNAVVRGDTGSIFIDDNSNVQDNSTLHTDEGHSIHIGKGVSIGHNAVVHGQFHGIWQSGKSSTPAHGRGSGR